MHGAPGAPTPRPTALTTPLTLCLTALCMQVESFFNFFSPPDVPGEDDEVEVCRPIPEAAHILFFKPGSFLRKGSVLGTHQGLAVCALQLPCLYVV